MAERHAEESKRMTSHRSILGYLYRRFTSGAFYRIWRDILSYLRRLRMIAWIFRIFSLLMTVIQTGALVILTTAVFLVLLPLAAALMLGILLTALIESRRTNRFLKGFLEGKTVYILFASERSGAFFADSVRALSRCEDAVVLVISPYWISSKGNALTQGASKEFYCTARREASNIFLIRKYYFFSLRRRALESVRTVYLY